MDDTAAEQDIRGVMEGVIGAYERPMPVAWTRCSRTDPDACTSVAVRPSGLAKLKYWG